MKFAMAVLTALLFAGVAHADSVNSVPPPDGYFYVNAFYSWTGPGGVEYEQFSLDLGNGPIVEGIWESGPVAEFPNLALIDPAQFGPNGPLMNTLVPDGYFYINAYYEWTAPNGVEMEQFFVDLGNGQNIGGIWEYGPVADFPNLGLIDPAQFAPNGQPLNGPEPATYGLLLVGMVGLLALGRYRIGAEDAEG